MGQNEFKQDRFGEILEDSLNEIYIFDADTLHFTTVNRGARENLGYSMEELRALTPVELKPQFTRDSFAKLVEPLRSGKKGKIRFTTVHRRKDRTQYPVEVHLQMSIVGSPVFVAIILDITERIRAEKAIRVADRLSAMGTLVAGVAHEINTPLTTILGLSQLMAKDPTLNEHARQHADVIVSQSIRAAKIVEDLLGLARTGRVSLESVQINSIIKRSLNYLRGSHRFDGVDIVEEYGDAIPEISADPYRLEQVFVNIIRNAGDALREARSIRRLTIRTDIDGDQLRAMFSDTGHGVDRPTKVFDPFYTTKGDEDGIGLGLSVSLGIIRDHGGDITLETSDACTQFLVTLPIRANESD